MHNLEQASFLRKKVVVADVDALEGYSILNNANAVEGGIRRPSYNVFVSGNMGECN